jgi:FkbM family methyltransferase
MGLDVSGGDMPLPADVGYYGQYVLLFEKSVAGWWIGRKEESQRILIELSKAELAPEYATAVKQNLVRIGIKENNEVINPLEPVVMNYRKYFGVEAPTIFDIGTRDGKDADYLTQSLYGSKTYAIDANPIAVAKVTDEYSWMKVLEFAVSDFDGEDTFQQVNSGNENMDGCSSLYADKVANEPQFKGVVNVIPTIVKRMDTLLQEENVQGVIDVVKVDVEGYTWEVLQGFGDRLYDVKLFHLETEKEPTHENHKNSEEIYSFLFSKGFELADKSYEGSNGINGGIEDQVWVNIGLATRNKDCFTYRRKEAH